MTGERRPWSKWRFLALYWAVLGPLTFFGWGILAGALDASALIDPFRDPGFAGYCGGILASVVAVQGAFLLAVRPPGEGPDRRWSRGARCVLAGGALGVLGATAMTAGVVALDALGWLPPGTPLIGANQVRPWGFCALAGAATVVASAWLFLRSSGRPSARLSVAIAGFGAAGLSMGIPWVAYSVGSTLMGKSVSDVAFAAAVAGTLLLNWAVATPLLARFVRQRDRADALGRIAAWLFTGTVVEAAAVIPLDVMVRRKSNCYCGEGTLWTLTICWGVGLFALGPAVWLLPLARRRKRWYAGHCPVCDYDMRACMNAERCPECGVGWRAHEGDGA